MARPVLGFVLITLLTASAGADPVKHAIQVRIPFGDRGSGGSDDSAVFDLFEIRKTLNRIQERDERPTIVMDKREMEAYERQDLEFRNSDPNLAGSISTVGPETLRGELRPTDTNALFSNRIHANGSGASSDRVLGPVDPNTTPVTLRSHSDR